MTTDDLKLKLESRTDSGSNASRRLRKAGKVPTVIYGHGKDPKQCVADVNEWRSIAKQDAQILKVLIDGSKAPVNVLIKDVQYDYLSNTTLHVDLQEINMNEEITASVTINGLGIPAGTSVGGVLDQVLYELEVTCLPADLPETFEVDVTDIEINNSLYVKDITLPENVVATLDANQVVFHVAEPKVKQEAETSEESEEVAEAATEETVTASE
jgi:large subunit ribosomal protein L25